MWSQAPPFAREGAPARPADCRPYCHTDTSSSMTTSKVSSSPPHFREEIRALTEKLRKLEERKKQEADGPVETTPEVRPVLYLSCSRVGLQAEA